MSKAHKKSIVTPMVKKESSDSFFSSQILSRLEDMEHRMENMFSGNWLRPQFSHLLGLPEHQHLAMPFEGRIPKVDVIDKDDAILVKAELPGVDKGDIEVTMNDTQVTIKGSMHAESEEKKTDYYYSEISEGSFCRTVTLPCEVNSDKQKAKFKNGVLELTLPKVEKEKKKSIKIE